MRIELRRASGTEDAVVADFRGAPGQEVLKKPVDKLLSGKRDAADLLGLVVAPPLLWRGWECLNPSRRRELAQA